LGNEPVFEPKKRIYQRLVAGVTPFPKTDPGNMRESIRPEGPERIRDEEATWCRTDCSEAA
jgi:hypothetical protein